MTTNDDLWPEDLGSDSTQSESPLVFLRKQATALGARMKNIVEGEVGSEILAADDSPTLKRELDHALGFVWGASKTTDFVVYRFTLRAPALGDYRYVLFRVYQPVESFYPLVVSHGELVRVDSEKELAEHLRNIFSAESTRKVIATLVAQSRQ